MRDATVIGWRWNLVALVPTVGLAVFVGFGMVSDAATLGFLLAFTAVDAMTRWFPYPVREAGDEFLLVRGIATRRGLAFRRVVFGLLPIAAALAIAAALRITSGIEPIAPIAQIALAAVDTHLVVASLVRAFGGAYGSLAAQVGVFGVTMTVSAAVANGLTGTVLAVATLAGAPLALASLFREPAARGERRDRARGVLHPRDARSPSRPLSAIALTALRPALGRDPFAMLLVAVATNGASSILVLAPISTSAKLFSIWCLAMGLAVYLSGLAWSTVGFGSGWLRPVEWRLQLEWLIARPLSRATLAAGVAVASHAALLLVVAVGFGIAAVYAALRGLPTPPPIVALGFGLLVSIELGLAAFAAMKSARDSESLAGVAAAIAAPLVLPMILAIPELERGARGERAVLAPWAFETGVPWIAAHAPLALLALVAASALTHALAYRSLRSYQR